MEVKTLNQSRKKKITEQNPQVMTNEQRLKAISHQLALISQGMILEQKDLNRNTNRLPGVWLEMSCANIDEIHAIKKYMEDYLEQIKAKVTAKFESSADYLKWIHKTASRERKIHLNHFLIFFNRALAEVNNNCPPLNLLEMDQLKFYSIEKSDEKLDFFGFSIIQNNHQYCFPCRDKEMKFTFGIIN